MYTQRIGYIDYLKSWATLVMIEVHVVNCFLHPSLTSSWWFHILNFINGLVAPLFIFLSGYSFMVSTFEKREELLKLSGLFFKRFVRIVFIILVGYSIHIPYFSLKNILLYAQPNELKAFYNTDVLQCIGTGLLILLLLSLTIKNENLFTIIITTLGCINVLVTPYIWQIDFSKFVPLPIATYFNEMHGSLFPIFPWHGFLFLGGSVFLIKKKSSKLYDDILAIVATVFSILGIIFMHYRSKDLYNIKICPIFFFTRLSILLILIKVSQLYISKSNTKQLFFIIGKESLLIYWFHLQILYRNIFNGRSWEMLVQHTYGIGDCIYSFIAVSTITLCIALVWHRLKQYSPQLSKKIFYFSIALVFIKFLFL